MNVSKIDLGADYQRVSIQNIVKLEGACFMQRGEIERPPHLKNCVGGRAMVLNSTTPLYCPTLTLASNFSIFYKITLKLDLDKLQLIFKSNDFAYPHQVIKIAPIKRKWPI